MSQKYERPSESLSCYTHRQKLRKDSAHSSSKMLGQLISKNWKTNKLSQTTGRLKVKMAKRRKMLIKIRVQRARARRMAAEMIENQRSKPRQTRTVAQETMEARELNTISNSIIEILTPPKEWTTRLPALLLDKLTPTLVSLKNRRNRQRIVRINRTQGTERSKRD